MKSRIFNITQYEVNPMTGESLNFNEDNIKLCISHKTIKQYAYVRHDKDTYTADDKKNGYEVGKPKPAHWHIVLKTDAAIEIDTIAKWLGIPSQYVDVPHGRGAFLDCVQYLTHESSKEQSKGKHLYSDDEIKSNFNFRETLDKREESKLKGKDLDIREQMRFDVLYEGKTLQQCRKEDSSNYLNDCFMLEKYRHKYLTEHAEMPPFRINFYIDGKGGIGKNTASKLLAKVLFPDVEKPYFEVGASGVAFQHYDGEPVIIWNDKRASSFISDFGRSGTFDLLDAHPTDSTQNIKYGSTRLINQYNIINGVESYKDFLDGLAGEYKDKSGNFHKAEDKSQSYRRIPIILCLRETDFDCLLNKGVADGSREFNEYLAYKNIRGSFSTLAQRLEGEAQMVVALNMLEPALESVEKIKQNETQKISSVDEIPEEFKMYGKKPVFNYKECECSVLTNNYEIINRDKDVDIEEIKNKYELPFQ